MAHILTSSDTRVIWSSGGLLESAGITIIIFGFINIFGDVLDLNYILKLLRRWRFKSNYKKSLLVQYEANKLMTGKEFRLTVSFSSIISLYHLSLFFLPALPLASVVLLVSAMGVLVIQRYLFARVYCRPPEFNSSIALKSIKRISQGTIFYFLGLVVFHFLSKFRYSSWTFGIKAITFIVCLAIHYLVGSRLSWERLRKDTEKRRHKDNEKKKPYGTKVLKLEEVDGEHKKFKNVRLKFSCEYDRLNPITSFQKTREHFQDLKSKFLNFNLLRIENRSWQKVSINSESKNGRERG